MTLVTLGTRTQQRSPALRQSPLSAPSASAGALVIAVIMAVASAATARPAPQSFADLAEQVSPAVVTVSTVQRASNPAAQPGGEMPELPFPPDSPFRDFLERFYDGENFGGQRPGDPSRPASGVGSGFIMDPDGFIVTNNHVVAGADEIKVILKDGQSFEAELVGRDDKTDLALLKIESREALPYVRFGDSDDVRVGDWVMAIGNPFGLGGTVTAGIVSARQRDISSGPYDDFIQTDAAINKGNSGGPMFNLQGEVIGIVSYILSETGGSDGLGFVVASNSARGLLLEQHAFWGGVEHVLLQGELAAALNVPGGSGALVQKVAKRSPAALIGIRGGKIPITIAEKEILLGGDILLEVQGVEMGGPSSRARISTRLSGLTRGELMQVKILRNGRIETLSYTIDERMMHFLPATAEAD